MSTRISPRRLPDPACRSSAAAICSSVTTPRLTSSWPNSPLVFGRVPDARGAGVVDSAGPPSPLPLPFPFAASALWPLADAPTFGDAEPGVSPTIPAGADGASDTLDTSGAEARSSASTRTSPSGAGTPSLRRIFMDAPIACLGARDATATSPCLAWIGRNPGALESRFQDRTPRVEDLVAPTWICRVAAMPRTLLACSVTILGFLGAVLMIPTAGMDTSAGAATRAAYASKAAFCAANDVLDRATASATSPANAVSLLKSHAQDLATMKADAPPGPVGTLARQEVTEADAAIASDDPNDLANLPNSGAIDAYCGVDGQGGRLPAKFSARGSPAHFVPAIDPSMRG